MTSFGVYNTAADVDALVDALKRIAQGRYDDGYRLDPATGEYSNIHFRPDLDAYFTLE